MQMERERRDANGSFGNFSNYNFKCSYSRSCNDYEVINRAGGCRERNVVNIMFSDARISSPPPSSSSSAVSSGLGYIEHPVSKFDTLAGVAIKYGVEVSDIRKMNGLVTDHQMFALKSLQIPLPGRHPPSPCLANGSSVPGQSNGDHTPPSHLHPDLFHSFQSLKQKSPQQVSPAMSSLQGYYGLKPIERTTSEGYEMAVYGKGGAHYFEDSVKLSLASNPPFSRHRKSRSLINDFLTENGDLVDNIFFDEARESDADRLSDKLFRRHQKSEADFTRTPEMLLKDDNGGGGALSGIRGKGLALRTKASSRTALAADQGSGCLNPSSLWLGDSLAGDSFSGVRKSMSTPSLQDQDTSVGGSSSLRPAYKWNLKSDLQALSNVAIARPIFDGLPKPTAGRKNKAALD